MGNTIGARTQAAEKLRTFIDDNSTPGEQIVVISHSHGINVVKEYTNMDDAQHIDQVVSLGGPVRRDYTMDRENVGSYVAVSSENDWVQRKGGLDGSVIDAAFYGTFISTAERIDPQADQNINASRIVTTTTTSRGNTHYQRSNVGHTLGRQTIHGSEVWRQYVGPSLPSITK